MKRLQVLIMVTALLLALVQGCGKSDIHDFEISTANTSAATEIDSAKSNGATAETTGMASTVDVDKATGDKNDGFIEIEIGNGNRILYKSEFDPILKIVMKSGEERVICNDLPSPPSVSPDGKRIAYLSPYEWEVLSNVHIYDIDNDSDKVVLNMQELAENKNVKEQFTPKKQAWLDDSHILVVIQCAYGTVTQGGDLYVYDTREDNLRPLIMLTQLNQISGLKVEKDFVYLDIIQFEDESMKEYQEIKMVARTGQIYDAIRYRELLDNIYFASNLNEIRSMDNELEGYSYDANMPYAELSADLNGDGRTDEVKYQTVGGYDNAYILMVNDLELKSFGDNLDEKPYIVDIDRKDGIKEIAIQEFGPSGDERTYYYCYTGSELRFMGVLGGLGAVNGRIDGDGKVISFNRPLLLQTWFVKKEYKLDGNHLLEGIESDLYPVNYETEPLKLKTDLKLYEKPKSNNVAAELKAGDTIKLLGCDNLEWCCAQTAAGVKGWFAVDIFTVRENGLDAGEVFDGLCYAD